MAKFDTNATDKRRHSYAVLVRPTDDLPVPADVVSGYGLPGTDVSRQVVDMQPGDWVLRGVANHHSKQWGYTNSAWTLDKNGKLVRFVAGKDLREALKAWVGRGTDRKGNRIKTKAGLPPRGGLRRADMKGAGGPAAMVRLVVADRAGIGPDRLSRTLKAIDRLPEFRRGIEKAKVVRRRAALRLEAEKRQAEIAEWEADEAVVRQAIEDGIAGFMP